MNITLFKYPSDCTCIAIPLNEYAWAFILKSGVDNFHAACLMIEWMECLDASLGWKDSIHAVTFKRIKELQIWLKSVNSDNTNMSSCLLYSIGNNSVTVMSVPISFLLWGLFVKWNVVITFLLSLYWINLLANIKYLLN